MKCNYCNKEVNVLQSPSWKRLNLSLENACKDCVHSFRIKNKLPSLRDFEQSLSDTKEKRQHEI